MLVIRRLVRDLDIPVDILAAPTKRDADGLAISSRNAYLTPAERQAAPVLFKTLTAVAQQVAAGFDCDPACRQATAELLAAGFRTVDYVAVCDALTLRPVDRVTAPARVLAATRLGNARLIDNVAVGG